MCGGERCYVCVSVSSWYAFYVCHGCVCGCVMCCM